MSSTGPPQLHGHCHSDVVSRDYPDGAAGEMFPIKETEAQQRLSCVERQSNSEVGKYETVEGFKCECVAWSLSEPCVLTVLNSECGLQQQRAITG